MAVLMTDGWRGKIAELCSDFAACLADGQRPDPNWAGDYRLVSLRSFSIENSATKVKWKAGHQPNPHKPPAPVVDLARARIEREWEYATLH
jgi:hypothetical protein